jgi:hypothetical protein
MVFVPSEISLLNPINKIFFCGLVLVKCGQTRCFYRFAINQK